MGNALATIVFGAQVVEKMGGPMTPMTFNVVKTLDQTCGHVT